MLSILEHIAAELPGEANHDAVFALSFLLTTSEKAEYVNILSSGDTTALSQWCVAVDVRLGSNNG